jgi:hypothetical protein
MTESTKTEIESGKPTDSTLEKVHQDMLFFEESLSVYQNDLTEVQQTLKSLADGLARASTFVKHPKPGGESKKHPASFKPNTNKKDQEFTTMNVSTFNNFQRDGYIAKNQSFNRLTENERDYLTAHHGCVKCRIAHTQESSSHHWRNCTFQMGNEFPTIQQFATYETLNSIPAPPLDSFLPAVVPHQQKFLFNGTIDSHHARILFDTGNTTMAVSTDYIIKHNLKTYKIPSTPIGLGLKHASGVATEAIKLTFQIGGYKRKATFYVTTLREDMLLGIPLLLHMRISYLDWSKQIMQFYCCHSNQFYSWQGCGRSTLSKFTHQ